MGVALMYRTGTVQWKISGDTEKARRELTGLALKWLHHARDAKHLGNFGYFDTGWKRYPQGNIRVVSNLGIDTVYMNAISEVGGEQKRVFPRHIILAYKVEKVTEWIIEDEGTEWEYTYPETELGYVRADTQTLEPVGAFIPNKGRYSTGEEWECYELPNLGRIVGTYRKQISYTPTNTYNEWLGPEDCNYCDLPQPEYFFMLRSTYSGWDKVENNYERINQYPFVVQNLDYTWTAAPVHTIEDLEKYTDIQTYRWTWPCQSYGNYTDQDSMQTTDVDWIRGTAILLGIGTDSYAIGAWSPRSNNWLTFYTKFAYKSVYSSWYKTHQETTCWCAGAICLGYGKCQEEESKSDSLFTDAGSVCVNISGAENIIETFVSVPYREEHGTWTWKDQCEGAPGSETTINHHVAHQRQTTIYPSVKVQKKKWDKESRKWLREKLEKGYSSIVPLDETPDAHLGSYRMRDYHNDHEGNQDGDILPGDSGYDWRDILTVFIYDDDKDGSFSLRTKDWQAPYYDDYWYMEIDKKNQYTTYYQLTFVDVPVNLFEGVLING
jgi:hypothetical protein